MKRYISILLAMLMLMLSLTGCDLFVSNDDSRRSDDSSEVESEDSGESADGAPMNYKSITLEQLDFAGDINLSNIQNIGSKYGIRDFSTTVKSDTLLPFTYNELLGFCDDDGNVAVDNVYDSYCQTPFSDGRALVSTRIETDSGEDSFTAEVIDESGNVLYTLPKLSDPEYVYEYYSFNPDNYYRNGKFVFGVSQGWSVIPCVLDESFNLTTLDFFAPKGTRFINEPEFTGFFTYDNDSMDLYNIDGEIMCSIPYDSYEFTQNTEAAFGYDIFSLDNNNLVNVFFFKNGYANVMNESGKWGLMDLSTGDMTIDYEYDYVGAYGDGVVPVCKYGKWGLVNLDNEIVVDMTYSKIGPFSNGHAVAVDENSCGVVIDTMGNVTATFPEDSSLNWNEAYFAPFTDKGVSVAVASNGYYYFISVNGDVLTRCEERDFWYYSENYIAFDGFLYKVVVS